MKLNGLRIIVGVLVVIIVGVLVVIVRRDAINHERASMPSIVTASATPTQTTPPSDVAPASTVATSTEASQHAIVPKSTPSLPTSLAKTKSTSSSEVKQSAQPSAIQPITPATPTALHIHDTLRGINIDAIVNDMAFNKEDLTPIACTDVPDDVNCPNTAFYVADSLGTLPGYPTDSSTYILGHAYSEGPRVFNQLSDYILSEKSLIGLQIVVDTPNGSITYEVEAVGESPKKDISNADRIWDIEPNYLKLIMCALTKDFNLMVYAKVVSTQPK